MRSGRICAALAALAIALGDAPARAETLEQRVERMERELRELKAELRRRDEAEQRQAAEEARQKRIEVPAPAGQPKPATTAGAPAAPPAPAPAATAQTRPERAETPHPTTGVPLAEDRVKVGGYGSLRFEVSDNPAENNTFEFRRFVLTTDARIAPRLSAYLELEFERFRKLELEKTLAPAEGGLRAQQTVEGTNDSEIALEQIWLQYDIQDWLKFRGGGVLVPLGRFNINHDDNRWDLPRRSLVDRGVPVLPATSAWDELGVGFLGDVELTEDAVLNYQAYVVNGVALDFEFEQIAQTRFPEPGKQVIEIELEPSTGTFGKDVKNAKAFTGRVAVSPALGHEVAGSWYYGRYTPEFLSDESLWSLGGDWKSVWGPFELEGEYVFTRFGGTDDVARSLARVARDQAVEFENPDLESEVEFELASLARTKQGYWIDLRYRFWPGFLSKSFLAWEFENPQFVAVLRGEQAWLDGLVEEATFAGGRLVDFETDNRRVDRITLGLAYRPVPLVVFQLAYEFTQTNKGKSLSSVTNFIAGDEDRQHALLLGAAFGF
jgi:hypothetical protein